MAGEALAGMEPNWMLLPGAGFPATGPPLGIWPTVPLALMVTDDLREWSPGRVAALTTLLPLAMVGPPMTGTAGAIAPETDSPDR